MKKGSHYSEEGKRKLSDSLRGIKKPPLSEEHRKNLIEALKKRAPFSEEWRRNISKSKKGKKRIPFSKKAKINMSIVRRGSKNVRWKGGISPIVELIRKSAKYKQWRTDCFIRDAFACQKCGDNSGGNLVVHHKKPFYKFLVEVKKYLPLFDLYQGAMLYIPLWDLNNGITLCIKCHGGRK